MNNVNFCDIPATEKIAVFQVIANKTGMNPYAVEKDWWAVQTLAVIFEMGIGEHLVFKGGTSLSKAWGLIERFSEDIDLAVDRSFFGFKGELSRGQITNLRKAASTYISEKFYPELQAKFQEKGFNGVIFKLVETQDSDQDPRIIEIYYPTVVPSSNYIQPLVQVEIGCRSLREPFSLRTFSSLVNEHFADAPFVQKAIDIPTVNPSRTFLEKIFLLHEEFQRPKEKIRVNRLSRHLYDIYQLSKTDFAENAINDKELYETIIKHRYRFTKVGGVDYNRHQPQFINPIPPSEFIEDWRADYKSMQQEMIYGNSPSFDEILEQINAFLEKMKLLKWTTNLKF